VIAAAERVRTRVSATPHAFESCNTFLVTIDNDLEAMLNRVIADEFDGEFIIRDVASARPTWIRSLEVVSRTRENRTVIIRVGRAWIGGVIPHLGIGAEMIDESDDIPYKEDELRKLCRALRLYLEGEGDVVQRNRLFGRGSITEISMEVDGLQWHFGRRSWLWAHPV
jgi:hypothetical protein